jgi:DinB superfamily
VRSRFELLAATAPDVVVAWNGIAARRPIEVRLEVRRRAGEGSAARVAEQLGAVAAALAALITSLPDEAFAMPGGEADWNVAQAIGHTADARAQLALAASLAAAGRWPTGAPEVVPGVPGDGAAGREALLHRIAVSQRIIERSVRAIAGHETDACPLVHPLVGRLRCGEWLLFAGVHDLMHLEQLEALEARLR